MLGIIGSFLCVPAFGGSAAFEDDLYDPGRLRAVDSVLKVAVGDRAPDFSLPALGGGRVTLRAFEGRKNVVLSFVPAAWTPVCSDQWPGYNLLRDVFGAHDAQLLGITVDNLPTLHAWTRRMGNLWFQVLSDFWPHGAAAEAYGVLRSDGTAERAIFIVDKSGIIRYIEVSDINVRPNLADMMTALAALTSQ
jgi:peroxiredoxin (alkyl hydroperoxide reductase subunit C)